MINLPIRFCERMKQQLGGEYEDYLHSFEQQCLNGLRVNTRKLEPEAFQKMSPFGLRPIPWVTNGFYYEGERPAIHPYYYAGLYYLQEPSAMTPASLLPVTPGDRVLDLCAAPGGKSTELAARLQGKGVLVSNDISNSRAKALLKNLELFGADNILVVSEAPNKLADYFPAYFDKILVDAPCSGEGMFRKSPAIMKNWEQYGTGYYQKLQAEILPQAVHMLKPGGYLLYSTCTFSPEEDEGSIQELLDAFPDLMLMDAIPDDCPEVRLKDAIPDTGKQGTVDYSGFSHGRPDWLPNGSPELAKTIRLWPHKLEGEGHFIALLKKREAEEPTGALANPDAQPTGAGNTATASGKADFCRNARGNNNRSAGLIKPPVLSEETTGFLKLLKRTLPTERLQLQEDRLYLLPELGVNVKGLRTLRSGLLLEEQKTKRFEPSQALACALKAEEYDNCYHLSADDPEVVRYLKCEAIEIKAPCKEGWVLICVDGFPLGWGKYTNGNFKNKYFAGWRKM